MMMGRSAWPLVLIAVSLWLGAEPAPCAGQPPAVATAADPPPRAKPATAPPLPSTVSPVIDRFMKQRGRDLPAPPPLAMPATGGAVTGKCRPPGRLAVVRGRAHGGPRPIADATLPLAAGDRREARSRADGADRRPVPDQPGDGAAAGRRPATDRRCGAGPRLGRRGRPHAGQGPLDPRAERGRRLRSPRRRRPGFQQGHHDGAQRQLLLRRRRLHDIPRHDRRPLPAPGGPAGPECPPLGRPVGQERRPLADRRRLLHGAPVSGPVRRHALLRQAGPRAGREARRHEPRPGPGVRGRAGAEHGRRPGAARRLGAAAVADPQRQPHAGPAAGPALGGRAARARPPPDHADRPRPLARGPDADRPGQPPRGRRRAGR